MIYPAYLEVNICENLSVIMNYFALIGMNPREFASLLSTFGGVGGAAGLMQGLQRAGGGSSSTSNQHTADSRPNTAPASTHSGVTASASTNRTGASGSSSKPRNGGTSSSSSSTAAAPKNTATSATSSGTKSGSIQINALTSVLANLSGSSTDRTTSESTSVLYDIVNHEVGSLPVRIDLYVCLFRN